MSNEKSKVTDKASEIAKNIWLAGVGAYGKAVEDAQDRMEKAGMETPKLFRELVKAGSALEDEAKEALETTTAARHSVEERINKVRENFHMQRPARIEDVVALSKKVDQLSRKVDRLSKALAEAGVSKSERKAAAGKAPAKKARARSTTRTKAKAAKKTTTRKKAPARKTTTRKRKA
jgi:hypothetical protein